MCTQQRGRFAFLHTRSQHSEVQVHFATVGTIMRRKMVEPKEGGRGPQRVKLIESQTLHGPRGSSFWYAGRAGVLRIYREISDSTNDMESPPVTLEPPRAAWRVVLNAGGTACRVPQEQTCRRSAAVLRIVIFKYSHI